MEVVSHRTAVVNMVENLKNQLQRASLLGCLLTTSGLSDQTKPRSNSPDHDAQ